MSVSFEPTPENMLIARTACWESLHAMATADVDGQNRNGDRSMLDADSALFARTALRLIQRGFDIRPNARPDDYLPVYRIVRETFVAAVG